MEDLNRIKIQQEEDLKKTETTIKDLNNSLALEIQRWSEFHKQDIEKLK